MKKTFKHGGFIEVIDYMGNDEAVVEAARVSYQRKTKGKKQDAKLLNYLVEHGHMSPFEHVIIKFRIKAPIFVIRQWMRYRTHSFNEVSRRYTSENIEFYNFESFRFQSTDNKQMSAGIIYNNESLKETFDDAYKMSLYMYETLLSAGVAREQSRAILPLGLMTTVIDTVDLRNLFHFLDERTDEHAQEEIREYALTIREFVKELFPMSYEAYYNNRTKPIPVYMDSKSALVKVMDEGKVHYSWLLNDGRVISFELIPDNYPEASITIDKNLDEYKESISEVPWIMENYEGE